MDYRSDRMRLAPSWFILALVTAAVAWFAAGAGSTPKRGVGGAAMSGPVVVPVRVDGGPGTTLGARPVVDVRIGSGPSVPVLLDTGGSGLEVYPSGLDLRPGGGIALTGRRFGLVYQDGSIQRGPVASGKVTLGGVTTARDIQFGVIRSVGCASSEPHCPLNGVSPAYGLYGVLGTSLRKSSFGLENPLRELPAPYSRSWSIHLTGLGGVLTLGAPLPSDPNAQLQLPAEKSSRSEAPAFDDADVPVCWRFGETRRCLPTLFDTGSNLMGWFSPSWRPAAQSYLAVGTVVSASKEGAGRPFWSFFSGSGASQDVVTRLPSPLENVNTGVQAFYALEVTYDPIHGRLFLTEAGTVANQSQVSNALREANAICVTASQQTRHLSVEAPPVHIHDLASVERTAAFVIRRAAAVSLRADSRLSRLRLPAADMPQFARALTLRDAEAHQMLSFASTLTRDHTWNAYNRAGSDFRSHFRAAQLDWSNGMNQLGIGGCTAM